MGQDMKFVHLLSNTHKHTACFHPQDKCFHIYVFHFLCVYIQNHVNDLLLNIYTLHDLVTLGLLLADTGPNEHDMETCRLQEDKLQDIIIIVSNNDGEYRQTVTKLCKRIKSV